MLSQLDQLFSTHAQALRLASQRQDVLAANIANVDTPNFKARDFDFGGALRDALAGREAGVGLVRTVAVHIQGGSGGAPRLQFAVPTQPSLDGNSVEMDVERAKFADNAVHVQANLNFLNGQIRTMLAAIEE
jgi:flagellar basal-body rod protein FlgB